jgi:hypothetical protein
MASRSDSSRTSRRYISRRRFLQWFFRALITLDGAERRNTRDNSIPSQLTSYCLGTGAAGTSKSWVSW